MSRAALAALALLLLPGAAAQGGEPPTSAAARLDLGPAGGEASLRFPFTLREEGEVYVKLLPTPWNPVLPSGSPNGSVSADRTHGLRGWWVHLVLEPHGGPPLDLGHRADGAPTVAVRLAGGQEHVLDVRVRAPPEAGPAGAVHRIDLALAQRGEGAVDRSVSLAGMLTVATVEGGPGGDGGAAFWLGLGGVATLAFLGGIAVVRRARRPERWL